MTTSTHPGLVVLRRVCPDVQKRREWVQAAIQAYIRELESFGRHDARSIVGYLADDWPLETDERKAIIDFIEDL